MKQKDRYNSVMPRLKTIVALVIVLAISTNIALLLPAHVLDGKITWSRDISRVVYKHCASCHHDGGTAASLLTYQQAWPRLQNISQQVCSRSMPPWNAVKGFGEFRNDPSLTQEEIEIIAAWVAIGGPEGDPAYLPSQPDFDSPTVQANPKGARLMISGLRVTKKEVIAIGIRPQRIPPEGELQVIARRPDGSVEPLIWVKNFNPSYKGTYYFREPIALPAGTRIEMIPRNGEIALFLAESKQVSTNK